MKARQLISDGSYGPDELKLLCTAFDDAWSSVAANFGEDLLEIEAARLNLANIILSFRHNDIRDADHIKNSALQIMALGYKSSSA